tara:strand:- start:343 stop:612 length:270 start_codon:yes stop_codon:yes gene_type:complete
MSYAQPPKYKVLSTYDGDAIASSASAEGSSIEHKYCIDIVSEHRFYVDNIENAEDAIHECTDLLWRMDTKDSVTLVNVATEVDAIIKIV